MQKILLLAGFLWPLSFSAGAEDVVPFYDDFESAPTYTDAPIKPGDTCVFLSENETLSAWPTQGGDGVVENDNPLQKEYFGFSGRAGNRLTGVRGMKKPHRAGVEVRINGMPHWQRMNLANGSNDSSSAIDNGFGLRLNGRDVVSRDFKPVDTLYVRYDLKVNAGCRTVISDSERTFSCLHPDYLLTIGVRHQKDTSFFQFYCPRLKALLALLALPVNRPACLEYYWRNDPEKGSFHFSVWLNGSLRSDSVIPYPPKSLPPVSTLSFSNSGSDTTDIPEILIDRLVCGLERTGPPSPPLDWKLKWDAKYFYFIPADTPTVAAYKFEIADSALFAFPLLCRSLSSCSPAKIPLARFIFPARNLTIRGCVKRLGADWSDWRYDTLTVAAPATPRPRVDSLRVCQTGKRRPVTELEKGRWYDLFLFLSDAQGFEYLYYAYCVLNSSRFRESDAGNQGGLFDPSGNYFFSPSCERLARQNILFFRSNPGFRQVYPLNPSCTTTYLAASKNGFDVLENENAWKITFRIPESADIGTWLIQVTAFNKDEIPSLTLRKKIRVTMVSAEHSSPGKRLLPGALILSGLLGIAITAGLRLRRRKAGAPPVMDLRVKTAMTFIQENYMNDISVNLIADKAGANPVWLGSTFKKQAGIEIKSYINDIRCQKAAELLKNAQISISQVAYKVGFSSSEYFYEVFKKQTGKSPREFRKSFFNDPEKE